MKVRKLPVEVEAWPVDDLNGGAIPNSQWTPEVLDAFQLGILMFLDEGMRVNTLEGVMEAPSGWWIIKGVNGEFYPCDPDVFSKTYEVVS